MNDTTSKLVIGIASRALFDLTDSHDVFEQQGVAAYCRYQIEHEDAPLSPGVAFSLARKLLAAEPHRSSQSARRSHPAVAQ